MIEQMLRELRYAWRLHNRSRLLSVALIVIVGISIGASSAVFSVVYNVLLKSLPFASANQIVIPWRMVPPGLNLGYDVMPWGGYDFRFFEKNTTSFEKLAAFKSDTFNLTGSGTPLFLEGARVSGDFFSVLQVAPAIGREIVPADDQSGNEHVVVLSHALWRDRFGADPRVIGQSITLSGTPYTIIGVMPSGISFPRANELPGRFDFPRDTQLWVP